MNWRLILDGPASGAWNMAADEALLEAAAPPDSLPVLRFYGWQPACLSLGRFQKFEGLRQHSAVVQGGEPGLNWVRRPTGGRAVWHDLEITYCAVLRAELLPPEAQSVAGAYRYLSEAFIDGLQSLGVQAALAPAESREQREAALRTANCFASATRCDFLVDGRKLIGAAQCRRNGVILQHGSLLLDFDETAWARAVGEDENVSEGVVSLRSLGVDLPREAVITALCEGVERRLSATLSVGELTEAECVVAKGLQLKYSGESWNRDGIVPNCDN